MQTSHLCKAMLITNLVAGVLLLFSTVLTATRAGTNDPPVVAKFGLEVEGKLVGVYESVSGIGSESEVIIQKITNPETGETIMQATPGRLRWLPVTLRRGVTSNVDVWEWRQDVVQGNIDEARTNCSIIAFDEANGEIARWNFDNAWPSKVVGPTMAVGSSDYMVEEIVIVHEGCTRVS